MDPLSTPQLVHACGSTHSLWNRWVGQIMVQFAVPFLGLRLVQLGAASRSAASWCMTISLYLSRDLAAALTTNLEYDTDVFPSP